MREVIFKSWKLTTDHAASSYGQPVLVNRATGEAFGPGDIVQCYPSWGYLPAALAVDRLAAAESLDDEQIALVSRFTGGPGA